jgi:hypothetical protein
MEMGVRREDLVGRVDGHDVVVAGDRPVRPGVLVALREVDRVLFPQPLEIGPHGVGLEKGRVGDVIVLERDGIGRGARGLFQVNTTIAHGILPRIVVL